MIKILYTVNGLRINGMSSVIMHYISMLNKNEYEFTLFTDEIASQFVWKLKENNVNIITSKNRKKNQLSYYRELKDILKKEKYDIIHSHGNSATIAVEMLAGKRCGVPVRIAHSHNTMCAHKFFDKCLRPLFYSTYTHGIGCGIEAGKWMFENHFHIIIKNGIDLKKFSYDGNKRENKRNELGINDKYVIGHIGRFTEQKNHYFIIDVFEKYSKINKNSVLLLVGDGPCETEIRRLVKEKGIQKRVIFYGTTSDTSSLYSAMDMFIFPSKFEGVPLTLVEAQASGLSCMISDRIDKEVIATDLIKVIPLSECSVWIDELEKIDLSDRKNKSKNAIHTLELAGFELENVIKHLDKFYKDSIGS